MTRTYQRDPLCHEFPEVQRSIAATGSAVKVKATVTPSAHHTGRLSKVGCTRRRGTQLLMRVPTKLGQSTALPAWDSHAPALLTATMFCTQGSVQMPHPCGMLSASLPVTLPELGAGTGLDATPAAVPMQTLPEAAGFYYSGRCRRPWRRQLRRRRGTALARQGWDPGTPRRAPRGALTWLGRPT